MRCGILNYNTFLCAFSAAFAAKCFEPQRARGYAEFRKGRFQNLVIGCTEYGEKLTSTPENILSYISKLFTLKVAFRGFRGGLGKQREKRPESGINQVTTPVRYQGNPVSRRLEEI